MTMNQNDHDQIIDQVISLENDFSDASSAIPANVAVSNVENSSLGLVTSDPIVTTTATTMTQPQHNLTMGDMDQLMSGIQHHQQQQNQQQNLHHQPCVMPIDNNDRQQLQLSSSSEDLLNLLLEFDRDSSNLISGVHPLDQDEKTNIETIRKQLMSCEVQSDQLQQHNDSMSPIGVSPMACHTQQQQAQQPQHHPRLTPTQHHQNLHQHQQDTQQLISQTAPIIPQHQQQHPSLTNTSLSQQQRLPQHHQRLSVDQSLLNGPYSATPVNFVPVSTTSQAYATQQQQQQQHQNVSRMNQSNPISIVNDSPSPSWQQNQPPVSPFSPQQNHQQQQPQAPQQRQTHPNATATSPQLHQHLQQHHHPLHQQRSPSQSVSPPVTTPINMVPTEPSPVVKKNPLLNAQLVNSRPPSLTPTRFLNNQTNVLNQNPILNSKLSQSPFITSNNPGTLSSPVNPSLNPQQQANRFVQQQQQPQQVAQSFSYDMTPQHHHQQTPPTTEHMNVYVQSGNQQQAQLQTSNQLYRSTTGANTGIPSGTTSPPSNLQSAMMGDSMSMSGNLSQQVKQEIRRKVQQPKQPHHQTTSLLKQLLSDDNK